MGAQGVGSANSWGGKKRGRSSLLCSQAPEKRTRASLDAKLQIKHFPEPEPKSFL